MDPIFSFTDHPSLKYDRPTRLYVLAGGFYWATDEGLYAIEPEILRYTNRGEPYRELTRLDFQIQPEMRTDSIDISFEDAIRFLDYCDRTGYPILLDSELTLHRGFQADRQRSID